LKAQWVWQARAWPELTFESEKLATALSRARVEQGRLLGKAEAVGFDNLPLAQQDVWAGEAMATAAIEGEALNLAAVRSSVARRLGMGPSVGAAPRDVEGLLDVMEDAARNWNLDLTEVRLCRWQAALFPTGYSSLRPVEVGRYRTRTEPMQIVSGPVGKETVHYEAPRSGDVQDEMRRFLDWFNQERAPDSVDGIVRAGIAHVRFESIHPFEDGNGRVGRAIVDMALAQNVRLPYRLHGMSVELHRQQKEYYEALNRAQRGAGDVTEWLLWFVDAFAASCAASARLVDESLARARFWSDHRATPLNERQRKALNRMLEVGPSRFEGGMTPRKYQALSGTTRITATRDLTELAANGLLVREGAGRSTFYNLAIPGWGWSPKGRR